MRAPELPHGHEALGELLHNPDGQGDDRERDQDQNENFRDPGLAGRIIVTASHHHIIVVGRAMQVGVTAGRLFLCVSRGAARALVLFTAAARALCSDLASEVGSCWLVSCGPRSHSKSM